MLGKAPSRTDQFADDLAQISILRKEQIEEDEEPA